MKHRVLDITRTLSRIGAGHPTGIDRVERAYIKAFLGTFPKAAFLAKLSDGYFILAPNEMQLIVDADFGNNLSNGIGLKDAPRLKLTRARRRAQSFVRKHAKRRLKPEISSSLKQFFECGFDYTNVGHSNLSDKFLSSLKPAGCEDTRIMVHDMIPLDSPEYCQAKTPQDFLLKMQSVAKHADEIICNSEQTKSRVQMYFADWKNTVSYVVAHLGVEPQFEVVEKQAQEPVSFTILGTVEPRKNHRLLLNVWLELSEKLPLSEVPILNIVGKRGWESEAFFKQLEASPLFGAKVFEYNDLDDTALNELLSKTTALLFPSFTEGYGLPALEALKMKVPVICSDIPVFRELIGENAHLLPYDHQALWTAKIIEVLDQMPKWATSEGESLNNFTIPTWPAHFRHVFKEYRGE